MAETASTLADLHLLHQRAKALRDRLTSAPKTLLARETSITKRQADVDAAKKALQDARARIKNREVQVQALNGKIDDLKVKMNAVKKNEEYKALQNQIAHDKASIAKIEDEMLESMGAIETQAVDLARLEAEVKTVTAEAATIKAQIAAQAEEQKAQLVLLEAALLEAETVIPEDYRERYRRTVKQKGAEALAQIDSGACSSCYVSITSQTMNELLNKNGLIFCQTCGCLLYLVDQDLPAPSKRSKR